MPMLTPSRLVVVVISFSLFSFLWMYGLPRELPEPTLPTFNHEGDQKVPNNFEKPTSTFDPELAHGPTTALYKVTPPAPTSASTVLPTSVESAEPSPTVEKGDDNAKEGYQAHEPEASASSSTVEDTPAPVFPTISNGTLLANATLNGTTAAPITCKNAPGASHIMVIVKTSKGEIDERLPTHLETLLSCVPNFAIFSDHAGTIHEYTIHDALADISSSTKALHPEFQAFEKLKSQETLPSASLTKELERWKWLPMVYQAFKLKPHSRFYIFIEADTSLTWTNLLQWTARLDFRIPYYIGAPRSLGDTKFARRDAGILVSNAAMQSYAKYYDEKYTSEWEERVGKECCGDMVLATAMADAHVELYNSIPLLEAENPGTVTWKNETWCVPHVSWHNMSTKETHSVWDFEKLWAEKNGFEKPIMMSDAYAELIEELIVKKVDEWENMSEDTKIVKPPKSDDSFSGNEEWYKHDKEMQSAVESWEKCRKACKLTKDCLQWKHTNREEGECHLGKSIRLGRQAPTIENGPVWTSGWMVERVKNATAEWNCTEPRFEFISEGECHGPRCRDGKAY